MFLRVNKLGASLEGMGLGGDCGMGVEVELELGGGWRTARRLGNRQFKGATKV